ncbi:hypothetical protein CNMCM5793_008968 [Aspergillus hiratsukae]|uniref:Uncharacterized protein n=1 Tax=Aspergillus hiratsukae TaxID=1194566 RepID=A0A8H6V1H9_9EURO|nr:hypothetical protein CNMCM5793_008968 [Aspergillus hiratsukae]KAF7171929.1 hypothetical protein CNMCM6106_006257 [Aspergillus hiratsukae]
MPSFFTMVAARNAPDINGYALFVGRDFMHCSNSGDGGSVLEDCVCMSAMDQYEDREEVSVPRENKSRDLMAWESEPETNSSVQEKRWRQDDIESFGPNAIPNVPKQELEERYSVAEISRAAYMRNHRWRWWSLYWKEAIYDFMIRVNNLRKMSESQILKMAPHEYFTATDCACFRATDGGTELMIRRTLLSRIPFDSDIAIGADIRPLQRKVVDVKFNDVEADEYKKSSLPHKRGLFIKSQIDPNNLSDMSTVVQSGLAASMHAPQGASGSGGKRPRKGNGDRRPPSDKPVIGKKLQVESCTLCKRTDHKTVNCPMGRSTSICDSLPELAVLAGLQPKINPRTIVEKCGSFLTTSGKTVSLIHQSAKEYLEANYTTKLGSGVDQGHAAIRARLIDAMGSILKHNIYALPYPGFKSSDVTPPDPDPLAPIRYSCIFWIGHLQGHGRQPIQGGGAEGHQVTGQGRPTVEPFAWTLVSLMLIEAICDQGGYHGEDEGEARTSKGQDIVFLDQETRLGLLVYVGGVPRNLNGKVDFAVWYEAARDGMGTNLVAIEAKRLGDARKGIPQCLCYMKVNVVSTVMILTEEGLRRTEKQREWFDNKAYQRENHQQACANVRIPAE